MSTDDPPWLSGGIVQRVERPLPEVTVLSVRWQRKTVRLAIVAGRDAVAIGGVTEPPKRAPSRTSMGITAPAPKVDGELRRWRNELEGALVVELASRADGGWHRLTMTRGGERRAVVATAAGATLLTHVGAASTTVDADAPEVTIALETHAQERGEAAERALARIARAHFEARRRALIAALDRATRRMSQRAAAVQGDLAKIAEAGSLSARATLLAAHAHAIPRGAQEAVATDWSSGEAVTVTIPLDPAVGAREQADALFRRAKRMKRGAVIATQRLAEALRARDALASLSQQAKEAASDETLDLLTGRAEAHGARTRSLHAKSPRAVSDERLPYRVYKSGARTILVGRSAGDNDALTTRIARPHDLWLHAKGVTGAHVVVPLAKTESCPTEVLLDAAHLAAHFSDAREERVVEITHVAKRYVRKPRGAAAGAVVVEREKVLVLRVEPSRLTRLLSTVVE